MEELKEIRWYNQLKNINDNFDLLEEAVNSLENGELSPAPAVANLAATTNITAVPATFADEAAIRTYLAGTNVIPNIEVRLDNLESKVNAILAALRTSGVINT